MSIMRSLRKGLLLVMTMSALCTPAMAQSAAPQLDKPGDARPTAPRVRVPKPDEDDRTVVDLKRGIAECRNRRPCDEGCRRDPADSKCVRD